MEKLWKCPKCNRRYIADEERNGNLALGTLYPRKKPLYHDCCVSEYVLYMNTRWRGRIVRGVFFTFEPVNNNYHNLDILFPKK